MKLIEVIDLKIIIFNLFKKDLDVLIENYDFELEDEQKEDLIAIGQALDCRSIFEGLNNFFEKNLNTVSMELNLMMTLLLQRYNYFFKTELKWREYCEKFKEVVYKNPGDFFLDYAGRFFDDQIDFYSFEYSKIVKKFKLDTWNLRFSNDLKSLITNIAKLETFQEKLQNCEKLVLFLQDTKNIYSSLESIGVESEKQAFLANTNEVKIIFQSLNNLVNEILKLLISS